MIDGLLVPTSSGRWRARTLRRSTVWVGAAHVTGQSLAVVTAVLLARRLGVAGFGVYAFATAAIFVANVVTTFGTDLVLIREVARDGRLDRCAAALGVQVCLSVVAIGVIGLIGAVSVSIDSSARAFVTPTRLFSLALLPSACFSVGSAMLRGLGLMRPYAVLVIAAAAMPLAGVAAFVRRGDSLERTMTVLLAAQVLSALAAVALCARPLRAARPSLRLRRVDIWAMARSSRTVGALGLVGVLYQRLAMLGVSFLVGASATGWYSGASRIVEASKVGHVAVATAAYPLMVEDQAQPERVDPHSVLRRSWITFLVLGAVVSIALLIVGPALIARLYGDGFVPSERGLRILAIGVVPSTMATFCTLSLLAARREREVLQTMAFCVLVLAAMSLVLVPPFGWIGACWAMTIADITQAAVLTVRHRRTASTVGLMP